MINRRMTLAAALILALGLTLTGCMNSTTRNAQPAPTATADFMPGTTDGWICDKEASSYDAGRTYADGSLNSAGVSVKTSSSGAGATSVLPFDNVRRVTINFCQNSSLATR